ncbi:ATP synthase subunit I [Thiorhodovibrio frisius]|uniref:F1/F0 ATPase, subunit 2 n=1 Tax=Thiorhodovibrio frisius TaxID=631362 RepID=H8Z6M9_9GAMM|nr:ATP synthase subunit I [Thiorhodovibrio frisius]EIC20745.1 F1/F0 ATPase, subunit 2 [Thiorhodovibrio frisius]WPL21493.1 F1/F0 ATPase, Methanosarcina type, subunit 2 [Thiorhodovibrio frisius]
MNETLSPLLELDLELVLIMVLAGVAGLALGAIFFGGLWWTLRKSLESPRPALWLLGSLLVRMGVLLFGLYLISDGHWEPLLAALLGVIGARALVLRWTRPADHPLADRPSPKQAAPSQAAANQPSKGHDGDRTCA